MQVYTHVYSEWNLLMAGDWEYDHRFMKINFGSKFRIWNIDENITIVYKEIERSVRCSRGSFIHPVS